MDKQRETPEDLDSWASRELERAQAADTETRLKVLEELHEVLEADLDEDTAPRS